MNDAAWVAESVGKRIRKARRAAGISQRDLAERIGVSAMTICNWENNRVRFGSERLCELGQALGVKPGYFHLRKSVELSCSHYE